MAWPSKLKDFWFQEASCHCQALQLFKAGKLVKSKQVVSAKHGLGMFFKKQPSKAPANSNSGSGNGSGSGGGKLSKDQRELRQLTATCHSCMGCDADPTPPPQKIECSNVLCSVLWERKGVEARCEGLEW